MKEKREEDYQKKNRELMRKLQNRDKLLITALENKEKDKMKEKQRAIAVMIEREIQAKVKVEKHLAEQEKQRIKFEKDIHKKSKFKNIL